MRGEIYFESLCRGIGGLEKGYQLICAAYLWFPCKAILESMDEPRRERGFIVMKETDVLAEFGSRSCNVFGRLIAMSQEPWGRENADMVKGDASRNG